MFFMGQARYINSVKIHPERFTREDKILVKSLNYDEIQSPVQEKGFSRIEKQNNIYTYVFCYENKLIFQFKFITKV